MKLSIIIPVLNEADGLPSFIDRLMFLRISSTEVIVVDGGSKDASTQVASRDGIQVIQAERGRARQMNAGAAIAQGDVLLFLHADTALPPFADQLIKAALALNGRVWGRFDVSINGRPFMLRVIGHLMNWRSRLTGIATGDQAIFVTRSAFESVDGFPDQPLMEDIELSKRLLMLSRPICLADQVITSGRRWEVHGVWRTIFIMWRLRWAYWRGVPASELAKIYR